MKLYRLGWIPCIYLLLLLSSCVADQRVPQGFRPIPDGMKAIDINFSVTNAREPGEMRSTETGEALRTATWEGIPLRAATEPGDQDQNAYSPEVLNENKIDKLDIFLVSKEEAATSFFKHFSDVQILEQPEADATEIVYKVRVLIPSSEVSSYEGQDFDIFVVANAQGDLSEITSIAELKAKTQEDDLNLLESNTPKPQPHFLMDGKGSTGTILFQDSRYAVTDPVALYRAAAKVRLRVSQEIEVIDMQNGTKTVYQQQGYLQVKLVSYLRKSSLLQGNPYTAQSGDWVSTPYRDLTPRTIPVQHPGSEEAAFLASFPFYAYESSWSAGPIDLQEAHLIVKAVLRPEGTDKEWKEYYYRIPLNYGRAISEDDKGSLHRVDRNHLYDVLSKIEILGGKTEDEAVEISSYVSVQPWNNPDPIDGVIGEAQYLVVREKNPKILNEENYDIQYASSLPVEIKMIEAYYEYYDETGKYHKLIENPFAGTITAAEPHTGGLLKIHHPVPTNYLPLHIKFEVKQIGDELQDKLQDTVYAIQYPPRYVTYQFSKGLVGGKSYNPYTGQEIYADFRHHTPFGDDGLTNHIFTKITTLVARDGEKIGDPRDNRAPGNTETSAETSQIISPSFIMATQYGITRPTGQYNNDGEIRWRFVNFAPNCGPYSSFYPREYPYYNYNYTQNGGDWQDVYFNYADAGSRAKRYFEDEYGANGIYMEHYVDTYGYFSSREVGKEFKHSGSWRLPTAEELKAIAEIQANPKSPLKDLLTGDYYWCGERGCAVHVLDPKGEYPKKSRTNDQETYTRLIFDVWQFPAEE